MTQENIFKQAARELATTQLQSYFRVNEEVSKGRRKVAGHILFEAYWEYAKFTGIRRVEMLILFYDLLHPLPVSTYGILTALWGSLLLAISSFEGPDSLAKSSRVSDPIVRMKEKARKSAVEVVGVIVFTSGILFQIAVSVGIFGPELITENVLQGVISPLIVAVGLALIGLRLLRYLEKLPMRILAFLLQSEDSS